MSRYLNLSKAARLLGITRTALQEEIRSGKIDTFEGKIDLAELLRAYPQVQVERSAMVERAQQIKDHALTRYSAETLQQRHDRPAGPGGSAAARADHRKPAAALVRGDPGADDGKARGSAAGNRWGNADRARVPISTWLRYKLDN